MKSAKDIDIHIIVVVKEKIKQVKEQSLCRKSFDCDIGSDLNHPGAKLFTQRKIQF